MSLGVKLFIGMLTGSMVVAVAITGVLFAGADRIAADRESGEWSAVPDREARQAEADREWDERCRRRTREQGHCYNPSTKPGWVYRLEEQLDGEVVPFEPFIREARSYYEEHPGESGPITVRVGEHSVQITRREALR